MMLIDPNSPVPLHAQVESVVLRLVQRREHQDGKPLPGEIDLAIRLGVSRATVRQAMTRLQNQGVLERRRNAGTRVVQRPVVTQLVDWDSFSAEMTRQGVKLVTSHLQVSKKPVPGKIAYFFSVAPKRQCLEVIRVRDDEHGPLVEFRSWLHPRLGLNENDDFSQPLYELIQKKSNVVVQRSAELIGAVTADADLASRLGCPAGQAILTRCRQVSDVGGKPVEWCDCFYRADRFTYAVQLHRSKVGQP